jgi:predicted RNA-binding Zn-ribbon protein involved in translation (DUF1610 family)
MSLKFKCGKCGKDIIVKFLKVGEIAKCYNCETYNTVPTNAIETKEEPNWDVVESVEPTRKPEFESGTSSMNSLLKFAIYTLIISTLVFLLGQWYTSTHRYAAFGAMFGNRDTAYSLASFAILLGLLAFLVGIGLLIGGLVQRSNVSGLQGASRSRVPKDQTAFSLFCAQCGTKLQTNDRYCPNCGSFIRP